MRQIAEACGCSNSHLRNILAGRKEPSLRLANKLSEFSENCVPVGAFLRPDIYPLENRG